MLTLRIVTVALTLVVGSAIGVAGQDEEADPPAPAAFTAYPSGRAPSEPVTMRLPRSLRAALMSSIVMAPVADSR